MKPDITIVANDWIDESFVCIAEAILQKEFDRIPDAIWAEAFADIVNFNKVSSATYRKIEKIIKVSVDSGVDILAK